MLSICRYILKAPMTERQLELYNATKTLVLSALP